jgi:hypothetical protein
MTSLGRSAEAKQQKVGFWKGVRPEFFTSVSSFDRAGEPAAAIWDRRNGGWVHTLENAKEWAWAAQKVIAAHVQNTPWAAVAKQLARPQTSASQAREGSQSAAHLNSSANPQQPQKRRRLK